MHAPVFLLTDFGAGRHYAGILHAVLLGIEPSLNVVHLEHEVSPGSLREGGYLLQAAWSYLPERSVVVAVVDPGVGTQRKVLAARITDGESDTGRILIAPDNGLLTGLITELEPQQRLSLRHCERPDLCHPKPSSTFHGRDIFVPLGGAVASGLAAFDDLGPELSKPPVLIDSWRGAFADDHVAGEIVHIDRFGNLISNLRWADLVRHGYVSAVEVKASPSVELQVEGHRIECFADTFAKAAPGEVFAYCGSGGALEVALRDGRADGVLGACLGSGLRMRRAS